MTETIVSVDGEGLSVSGALKCVRIEGVKLVRCLGVDSADTVDRRGGSRR
jgi:hypothetical protein